MRRAPAARRMVNSRLARIFKRIFETRKSTPKAEKFAEIRVKGASDSCVYRIGINHGRGLRETHESLRTARGPESICQQRLTCSGMSTKVDACWTPKAFHLPTTQKMPWQPLLLCAVSRNPWSCARFGPHWTKDGLGLALPRHWGFLNRRYTSALPALLHVPAKHRSSSMFKSIRSHFNNIRSIKLLCERAEAHALEDRQREPGAEHFLLASFELTWGSRGSRCRGDAPRSGSASTACNGHRPLTAENGR